MQINILWFLFLSFFLSSCGSLYNKKEIVSFDSRPRGVEVYKLPEKKFMGITPFYEEVLLSANPQYELRFVNSQNTHQNKNLSPKDNVYCGPHLTPFLVDPLAGGRFDCKTEINLFIPEAKENQPADKLCHHYLIIPANYPFKKASDRISQEWINQNFKKEKKSCDTVIDPTLAEDFLSFQGLDYLSRKYHFQQISKGVIGKLAVKYKITHLVLLPYQLNNQTMEVSPQIYDVHTRVRPVAGNPLENKYQFKLEDDHNSKLKEFISKTIQWIPNSFLVKFDMNQKLSLRDGEQEKFYKTKTTKFDFFPGFRIGSIDYPQQDWNFNLRLSPSLSYSTWHENFHFTFLDLVMAAKTAFHTPIGTFFFRAGWGPGLLVGRTEDRSFSHQKISATTQIRYGYYIFVNERIFLMLDVNKITLAEKTFDYRNFQLKSITSTRIEIGTFLPEMKTTIKRIVQKD